MAMKHYRYNPAAARPRDAVSPDPVLPTYAARALMAIHDLHFAGVLKTHEAGALTVKVNNWVNYYDEEENYDEVIFD